MSIMYNLTTAANMREKERGAYNFVVFGSVIYNDLEEMGSGRGICGRAVISFLG